MPSPPQYNKRQIGAHIPLWAGRANTSNKYGEMDLQPRTKALLIIIFDMHFGASTAHHPPERVGVPSRKRRGWFGGRRLPIWQCYFAWNGRRASYQSGDVICMRRAVSKADSASTRIAGAGGSSPYDKQGLGNQLCLGQAPAVMSDQSVAIHHCASDRHLRRNDRHSSCWGERMDVLTSKSVLPCHALQFHARVFPA